MPQCAISGLLSPWVLSSMALLPLAHLYSYGIFRIAPEREMIPFPAARKPASQLPWPKSMEIKASTSLSLNSCAR